MADETCGATDVHVRGACERRRGHGGLHESCGRKFVWFDNPTEKQRIAQLTFRLGELEGELRRAADDCAKACNDAPAELRAENERLRAIVEAFTVKCYVCGGSGEGYQYVEGVAVGRANCAYCLRGRRRG